MNAARYLSNADPIMVKLIARFGPTDLKPRRLPPFQALAKAIIYQQLSGAAAGTILKRFRGLFTGKTFPTPAQVLQLDVERLRTAGLSRPKANYIRDLAQKTSDGVVPTLRECDRLTDAELVERLTCIKGVGRWTVEMLLIFNLGRPDVLPVHDLGCGAVIRSPTGSAPRRRRNNWTGLGSAGPRSGRRPPGIFGAPPMISRMGIGKAAAIVDGTGPRRLITAVVGARETFQSRA